MVSFPVCVYMNWVKHVQYGNNKGREETQMPHSSGGFSSGGGSHGGSSGGHGSSSGSSYRTSRTYFPGSSCYIYYDGHFRPHTLFTNVDPSARGRRGIGSYIVLGIAALIPLGILIFTGIHNPKKLPSDYPTTITIEDTTDAFTPQEEEKLKASFSAFFDKTGICPGLVTVHNSDWKGQGYQNLVGYGLAKYRSMYHTVDPTDESHFLMVYSDDDGKKTNYNYEGIQGNNTDPILTPRVNERFTNTLYGYVKDPSISLADAFNQTFEYITPTIMDSYFHVKTGVLVFSIIWEGMLAFALISTIVGGIRNQQLSKAVKAPNEGKDLVKKKCPYCDTEYYEGTITQCPRCGAILSEPDYSSFDTKLDEESK